MRFSYQRIMERLESDEAAFILEVPDGEPIVAPPVILWERAQVAEFDEHLRAIIDGDLTRQETLVRLVLGDGQAERAIELPGVSWALLHTMIVEWVTNREPMMLGESSASPEPS